MNDFDKDALLNNLMHDENLAREIVLIFISSAKDLLGQIENGLSRGDIGSVGIHFHSLAGAASNVGANRIAVEAAAGEKRSKEQDAAAIASHLACLNLLYSHFLEAVEKQGWN